MNPITALTLYGCSTDGCPLASAPRQLRELLSTAKPLHRPAQLCGACGEPMTRLAITAELEDADRGRSEVELYLAAESSNQNADAESLAAAESALAG
jgi:hypothetical protein